MSQRRAAKLVASLAAVVTIGAGGERAANAQGQPPDHPSVTVRGQSYTPRSILARNMGTDEDQTTAFQPHKIIGNIYYVGTRTLTSFLIVTPQGNILVNSTYERNVPVIQRSVEQLGFKFADTRILLGIHSSFQASGFRLRLRASGCWLLAVSAAGPEAPPTAQSLKPEA